VGTIVAEDTNAPSQSPTHSNADFNRIVEISLPSNGLQGLLDIDSINRMTALRLLNLTDNPLLGFPAGSSCEDIDVCKNWVCDLALCEVSGDDEEMPN